MGYHPHDMMPHGGYGMRESEMRLMEMARGMGHGGPPGMMYDPYAPSFGGRPAGCYKCVRDPIMTSIQRLLMECSALGHVQVWRARTLRP